MKNVFSIIIKNVLEIRIFIPVKKYVIGIKIEINPKLWKNKSEIQLPFEPIRFLIVVSLGKIKFGSSGEQVSNENNKNNPAIKIIIPKISESLLIVKFMNKLAVFLISIFMNQFYHFVSSNFCC